MTPRPETMPISDAQLRWMLTEAAEEGAKRALKSIGLEDEQAVHDVHEIRDLLRSWRATKAKAWTTAIGWLTTMALVGISAALAMSWWDRR